MKTILLIALLIVGCSIEPLNDILGVFDVPPCIALRTDMDTTGAALQAEVTSGAIDTATCAAALAAVTALKDNSCNASTIMMDGDAETWVVDAEDVAEIQEMCDGMGGN